MKEKKRKVLLVGWDAADWQVIDKLMANGLMPAFKSVVDRGVRGRLATLDPPLSPMLWTSMATGVRPYKHGISGFVENDGSGGVPITNPDIHRDHNTVPNNQLQFKYSQKIKDFLSQRNIQL